MQVYNIPYWGCPIFDTIEEREEGQDLYRVMSQSSKYRMTESSCLPTIAAGERLLCTLALLLFLKHEATWVFVTSSKGLRVSPSQILKRNWVTQHKKEQKCKCYVKWLVKTQKALHGVLNVVLTFSKINVLNKRWTNNFNVTFLIIER